MKPGLDFSLQNKTLASLLFESKLLLSIMQQKKKGMKNGLMKRLFRENV